MAFLLSLLTPQFIVAYILLALIVALLGRNRQIGFWGFLVMSLVFTPIIVGFFMIVCSPRKVKRQRQA